MERIQTPQLLERAYGISSEYGRGERALITPSRMAVGFFKAMTSKQKRDALLSYRNLIQDPRDDNTFIEDFVIAQGYYSVSTKNKLCIYRFSKKE